SPELLHREVRERRGPSDQRETVQRLNAGNEPHCPAWVKVTYAKGRVSGHREIEKIQQVSLEAARQGAETEVRLQRIVGNGIEARLKHMGGDDHTNHDDHS